MDQFLTLVESNTPWIILGVQLVVLLTLMILIHKINGLKRKTDRIIGKVENYLKVILEEEETEKTDTITIKNDSYKKKNSMDEAAQNRLISDVLQEIFP